MSNRWLDEYKVIRRVAGRHNYRLDGMTDLLVRAQGMSVLDLGCNRGMAGMDFVNHGATLVHGCDLNNDGEIFCARSVFADIKEVQSRFEVVDLSKGAEALQVFGSQRYDTILMLATYHKLKRIMPADKLSGLVKALGERCNRYLAWRGTSEKHDENNAEMTQIDRDLAPLNISRVHTSSISVELGIAAIWQKRV